MKKVLSLLLSYAFLQAQTWAIGGGPSSGTTALAISGTYSGVLITAGQTNPSALAQQSSTSIGLFSVGVPTSGPALGSAVVFVDGVAYIGDVTGVADPQKSALVGIVTGASNFDVLRLNPITGEVVATKIFAQGSIQAKISGGSTNALGFDTGILDGSTRLTGTATLDLFSRFNTDGTPDVTNTVNFLVDGFKQSTTVTTVSLTVGGVTTP